MNLNRDNIVNFANKIETVKNFAKTTDLKGLVNKLKNEDFINLSEQAFDYLADVGLDISKAKFGSLALIGLVIILIGFFLYKKKDYANYPMKATVTKIQPKPEKSKYDDSDLPEYIVDVAFTYNNKVYKKRIVTNQEYSAGDEIVITVDVRSALSEYNKYNLFGIILIGAAIIIFIVAFTGYTASKRSKLLAVAEGTGTIVNTINNLLKF